MRGAPKKLKFVLVHRSLHKLAVALFQHGRRRPHAFEQHLNLLPLLRAQILQLLLEGRLAPLDLVRYLGDVPLACARPGHRGIIQRGIREE